MGELARCGYEKDVFSDSEPFLLEVTTRLLPCFTLLSFVNWEGFLV